MTASKKDLELLKFPCDFMIKIMGQAGDHFEKKAINIIKRHVDESAIKEITRRHSAEGNYLALTVIIHAQNKAQLDSLYIELSETPEILMAL